MGQRDAVGLGGMAGEAERRPVVDGQQDAGAVGHLLPDQLCIGSIKADSSTSGWMQNRHNFWAKEAGLSPATVAPGPGAVLEPVFPNPLTSMA